MRRIIFCALFAIVSSAPLLNAQELAPDPEATLSNLADLNRRGQFQQVIETANFLLAMDNLEPVDRGLAFVYLAHAQQQRGEFSRATANYEKALAVVNRDGKHATDYAAALAAFATVYAETSQFDTAKRLFLRAVDLFEKANDHEGAAMIWDDLATIAAQQNSRRSAHKYMKLSIAESSLAPSMAPGELATLATTEGKIAQIDKDPHTAIANYKHALDLWKQTNKEQPERTAWLYVLLSEAYSQAGDIATARETVTRGLAMLQASSGRHSVRYLMAELIYSKILDAAGAHDEAATLRKETQLALDVDTDRQRAQSQVSISALR